MYHMRRASVRDLRYSFKVVEASLAAGEEIEIVKRNRVIAHLVPIAQPTASKVDFRARLRKMWGEKIVEPDVVDSMTEDRERF